MRLRSLAVAGLLAGCGASTPPPAPPQRAPALRTVAPSPAQATPKAPMKRLMVLHATAGELDDDALQAEVAKQSLAAEVGSSPAGSEIALPGVSCIVAPAERPSDVPKHFLPAEIAAHQLSEDEAKAIGETTAATSIECVISDDQMPVRGLPPMAEAAATAIARLTDGYVHDPQTGRYYSKAAWAQGRDETKGYSAERNIRVVREKNPDTGDYWLGTRGLVAFGRPDLEAFPVSDERVDGVAEQLRSIGDLTINEPEVASGLVMSLGTVDVLMIDRGLYAETLPAGTTGKAYSAKGESLGHLAIADPEAPRGDLAAHDAFLRKLLVR